MKEQLIDICPDCGGELKRNVCNECNTKWEFEQ